jgi:hypothetical protein
VRHTARRIRAKGDQHVIDIELNKYRRIAAIDVTSETCLIACMKTRLTGLTFIAAAAVAVTPLQAENAACCAKGAKSASNKKEWCANYAKLNLDAEQKTKLTALQEKCMKDGCTEETRAKFLKSAKKILSADQYAQLKADCDKAEHTEKKQS